MKIIYSDGISSVTMPKPNKYTPGGDHDGVEVKLAGGKIVYEMRGYRTGFTAYWDWVPQETITKLMEMLRVNKILNVTYYDPVDGTITRAFTVTPPTLEKWRYIGGVPRFHDITINHNAQELIK